MERGIIVERLKGPSVIRELWSKASLLSSIFSSLVLFLPINRIPLGLLEKEKIITISDLAKASVDKVASVAQINPQKAQKWIQMADLLLIESEDENSAELMVVGAGVTSRKDLSNKNPDKLYDQMQSALKMGRVPLPKGWSFTKNNVQKWINEAKGK